MTLINIALCAKKTIEVHAPPSTIGVVKKQNGRWINEPRQVLTAALKYFLRDGTYYVMFYNIYFSRAIRPQGTSQRSKPESPLP